MRLERARRVSVVESVTERLVALISEGHVRPGERLPSEQELMEQLQVGRSSVREAVRGLSLVGVVESRPRRGTTVVSPLPNSLGRDLKDSITTWAVSDLFHVRAALEGYAAEAAAKVATDYEIAEIRQWGERIEQKIRDGASYFRENRELHLSIARASHNAVLMHCLGSIIGSLRDMRERMTVASNKMRQTDMREHGRIIRAIELRQPERARLRMQEHLLRSIERMAPSARPKPRRVAKA